VNDRERSIGRLAAPVRTFAQRFAHIGLIVAAAALMLVGKMEPAAFERARAHVTDAIAPILDAISRPLDVLQDTIGEGKTLLALREENERLRQERDRLIQWQTIARKLETENIALRELLQFVPATDATSISARVIGDAGGAFARTMILNAGSREGVRKGQAVINGSGLIGRVQEVGRRSSRLLLLTDLNSRIPVLIERSRARGVVAGTNGDTLSLVHLPPDVLTEPGDRIVTSGHGGALPPGIPVGVVKTVTESGIAVEPFVDPSRLELVRILDYGLKGIIDFKDIRTGSAK
jgi:rod shape-determining protein MreC